MGDPGGLGWLGVWVVESIAWLVALVKRHELVNLLTSNAAHGGPAAASGRDGLAGLYFKPGWRRRRCGRSAGRSPAEFAVTRRAKEFGRGQTADTVARERLAYHADRAFDLEYERAREKLSQRRSHENELRGVEGALRPFEEARARCAHSAATIPLRCR